MAFDGATMKKEKGQINFAPATPLQKLKDSPKEAYKTSSLAQLIYEMHTEISNRHLQERRELAEIGRLMSNLRSGKLIMQRDPISNNLSLVSPLPNRPRRDKHTYPLAQTNSSQLTSIWTLSRPRAVPRHFGNTPKAQIQHAELQKIIDHYDAENFKEDFHQEESLSMMDFGTSGIRVFYDSKLNTIRHLQPIIENQNKTIFEGYGFCASCRYDGSDEEFAPRSPGAMPQCPECDSFNIPSLLPKQMTDVATIIGAREIVQGDIGADLLKIPACNWDMRVLMHKSTYFQYVSEAALRLVETTLGIEVDETESDSDFALQIINSTGLRGGSVEGLGRENLYGNTQVTSRVTKMYEEYYEPEWYAGTVLTKEEKSVSGEIIPAGVPLEEIFNEGLCAVGFNDMRVLCGVFNEKKRIAGGVYHIQSFSGVGKGTSDSIEISEQLNIAHTASLEQIKRIGAGGGYGYDVDLLSKKEAKALLKPGGLVGVSLKGSHYKSVQEAIWKIEHGEISQSNLAIVAQLSNLLNVCFQTTEFTTGTLNNVNVDTARGQEMLQAQNQQRSAAPLRMKGYTRAIAFEYHLELFREHIQIPLYFSTSDKFSLTRGKFISGRDLPERVRCDFVPDTEIPTNQFTKRQAAIDMLEKSQYFGVPFVELVQLSPRIATWWADQFGVNDIPLFSQQEILIKCQDRIDSLKEICKEIDFASQLAGFYPPLDQVAPQLVRASEIGVQLSEENHPIKAMVLGEYLDDDEVKDWSPLMRAAVEALIQLHYEYDEQNRARVQLLAQNTQFKLAANQQNFQKQMMQPQIEQQQNNALLNEGLNRAANLIEKEEDHQRTEEAKNNDLEREKELKQYEPSKSRPKQ